MCRGMLIAIEGKDGMGKSTCARAVAAALSAELIAFPRRAKNAELADILAGHCQAPSAEYVADLMAADRRAAREGIEAILATGRPVILDRYIASGRAYAVASGAPCGSAIDAGARIPDLTFYLHGTPFSSAQGEIFAAKQEAVDAEFRAILDRHSLPDPPAPAPAEWFDPSAQIYSRRTFAVDVGVSKSSQEITKKIVGVIRREMAGPYLDYAVDLL